MAATECRNKLAPEGRLIPPYIFLFSGVVPLCASVLFHKKRVNHDKKQTGPACFLVDVGELSLARGLGENWVGDWWALAC